LQLNFWVHNLHKNAKNSARIKLFIFIFTNIKIKTQGEACAAPFKVSLEGGRYAELTELSLQTEWIWDFGKTIRFPPSMVSACLCHSGKSCAVLRKWWTIWSVEWKTENPWTGDIIWEKISSSKPLNWQFPSGSTSCLMENGHCILRRYEWPWVFTNGKNWKRPYLCLKRENQNWQLTMCKIKYQNLYILFVIYRYSSPNETSDDFKIVDTGYRRQL